jgi:phosphoribosyl 1,2-cyclic phosphate phosphodiesterase
VLIDTPEESNLQLNRAAIREVRAGVYSHWHPDHVMGRRVWEALNAEWRAWPPSVRRCTPIYLPQQVAADFRERLGGWEHLQFFADQGWVELVVVPDGEAVELHGARMLPVRLAQDYVYAFVFEQGGRRLLVAPDELKAWRPPGWLVGVDLAVVPMGITEVNPLTGERQLAAEHPMLRLEATLGDTLALLDELRPGRAVLTHVEEIDGLSYDDLAELELRLREEERDVTFAYDTLIVDV